MKDISKKLKELRAAAGLSQEKLAEQLMVSRQAISKWENGEALPDMENMIALAKLYNTSLDGLVGIKVEEKTVENENVAEEALGADEPMANISIKKDGNTTRINFEGINIKVEDKDDIEDDLGDDFDDPDDVDDDFDDEVGRTININAREGEIKIDDNGISIGEKIKIDEDGININNGKVKIDSSGVIVNGEDYSESKKGIWNFLYSLPYPLFVTVGFFLIGFFADAWGIAWILFCTIPVYYSIITCIRKRRFAPFAYSVFATCIYLFGGMAYGFWHPGWVIFLTIPVYHFVALQIDKAIANRKNTDKQKQ